MAVALLSSLTHGAPAELFLDDEAGLTVTLSSSEDFKDAEVSASSNACASMLHQLNRSKERMCGARAWVARAITSYRLCLLQPRDSRPKCCGENAKSAHSTMCRIMLRLRASGQGLWLGRLVD